MSYMGRLHSKHTAEASGVTYQCWCHPVQYLMVSPYEIHPLPNHANSLIQ